MSGSGARITSVPRSRFVREGNLRGLVLLGLLAIIVRDLARRVLTFSPTSPDALGDKVDAMLRDVEQRLLPHSRDGVIREVLVSIAQVVTR